MCILLPIVFCRLERAQRSELERPLTLEKFDDRHQDREMVYGVTKDDIGKRITIVFRGTENELSFRTNWLTNLYISKTKVPMPKSVKELEDEVEKAKSNLDDMTKKYESQVDAEIAKKTKEIQDI